MTARASPARARRQENWPAFVNRPFTFGPLELGRRLGGVVRLPGIGRLVNDAETARAIVMDGSRFNSHDPGSFGQMITRVLGPRALINMEGPDHLQLKRHLMETFSARYVEEVIGQAVGEMVEQLCRDLKAGAPWLRRLMRQYGGAINCALVGVRIRPADQAAAFDEIFRLDAAAPARRRAPGSSGSPQVGGAVPIHAQVWPSQAGPARLRRTRAFKGCSTPAACSTHRGSRWAQRAA